MSINMVKPVDGNLITDMLLDRRNRMAKMLETNKFEDGEPLTKSESAILEEGYIPLIDEIIKFIFQLPAIRAYNNVDDYGYWMPAAGLKMKCSSCHEESYSGRSKFCPHCGVPMTEKKDVLERLC